MIERAETPPMQDEIQQFEAWCSAQGFVVDDLQHDADHSILWYVRQCLTNYADLMTAHESDRQRYRGIIAQKDAEVANAAAAVESEVAERTKELNALAEATTNLEAEIARRATAENALEAERRKPVAE